MDSSGTQVLANDLLLHPETAPITGGFRDDDYWTWCGSVIKGEDNRYHVFASRWSKRTAFNCNWLTNSTVVRAVSDTPEGPYVYVEELLSPRGANFWDGRATHNPTIHRYGDGYALFYTGITYDGETPTEGQLTWEEMSRSLILEKVSGMV